MNAKVVATGAGVISPLGAGLEHFACTLFSGKSAVGPSSRFPGFFTAELAEFHPQQWLGNKGIRVLDRSARLLAVASHMALSDSGLSQESAEVGDPEIGLVCGTLFGSVDSITSFDWSGLTDGPNLVNPMAFPNTVINSPAGQAAIKHKLRGVNSTVCAGLASGLHAIHYAAEFLRFGRARAILAGGVDELCEQSVLGFRKTGVMSPSGVPRPFSAERDGTVPGEGAALWMLETESSARARGRVPWVEICGFGNSHDALGIQTFNPRARGATEAMLQALDESGIGPEDIACVIASASGSRAGDEMEVRALENVFGPRLPSLPVCAPKSALGECMGASGAFAAIVAGLALQQQTIPPTAGFARNGQPLNLCSSQAPIAGDYAIVNAFGCDGNNASLVIKLWKN
jgi:3-oxoacyl-[acyl-carrier-protein] synthase II